MKSLIDFSSRFRILKGGKISLVVSALVGTSTLTFAAPSGGTVTSGSANISQVGKTTNIIQNTNKVTINWNKFNIATDEVVNFKQPNVNSIALNRVIGNEKSIINGALNANGQVWILNSNGVLFGKNARINTAGLLATTKNLSDNDFNAGNYKFTGSSNESIINLGEIDITDSGYAVLFANSVSNEGTIKAVKGSVRLVGAEEVAINFNGNSLVDLTVNKGVLDSLVENKGAIYADGGEIYLTTNAVDELLKGVVNNEGVIEANSLDSVTGHIELFAHGGEVQVGGNITATDGFVETSGKDFKFNDADIKAGEWLIDPVNITIDSGLATAIEGQLSSGDVTIETEAYSTPSNSTVDTTTNESGSDGDIFITSAINYTGGTASTLTLKAARHIIFGEDYTPSTLGSISSTNAALNVVLWSDTDGNGAGSVWLPSGSSISTNGGDVWIGGGSGSTTWNGLTVGDSYARGLNTSSSENGALLRGAAINGDISLSGGDIYIKGEAYSSSGRGVSIGGNVSTTGNGNITIEGISHSSSDAIAIGDGSISSPAGSITYEDGTVDISGVAGSSDSFYLNSGSYISSTTGNGTLVINGNNGNIISDSTSYIDVNKLLILDAATIDLQSASNNILNLITSNISGLVDFYTNSNLSIDTITYNSTNYSGLSVNNDNTIKASGNISVDSDIAWASNLLTLSSDNNILVNANLTATGTASLAFQYGQGTTNGAGSTYTVTDGMSIKIPNANNVTYKKGSASAETYLSFNNGSIRTLNYDTQASFDSNGLLIQPWYYNQYDNKWYKLTFANQSLQQGIAISGDGTNTWNTNGTLLQNPNDNSFSYEIAKYNPNGYGEIEVTNNITIDSKSVEIKNKYALAQSEKELAVTTTITNKEITDAISNVRFWTGVRDDYMGYNDRPTKQKGNISGTSFVPVSSASEQSTALKIEDTNTNSNLLFYTNSTKAQSVLTSHYGDILNFLMTTDPNSGSTSLSNDGSYGFYVRFNDLAAGESDSFTWSYAATAIKPEPKNEVEKKIENIVRSVTVPQAPQTTKTPNNSGKNVNIEFIAGENKNIVSRPTEGQNTRRISMDEARQMQQDTTGQNAGELRVPLSRSSSIIIVDGGVNLEPGVEQEFYVAEEI